MQATQTAPPPPAGPHVLGASLRRSSHDRVLLGLCGGVARATNTSPLAVRIGTIALGIILFPLVLLAYVVTALILPRDDGSTLIGSGSRDRRDVIVALILTVIAAPTVLGAAASHGLTSGHLAFPLFFLGGVAAGMLAISARRPAPDAPGSAADQAAHQAYASYATAAPAPPEAADPTAAIAAFDDPFRGTVTGPYPADSAEDPKTEATVITPATAGVIDPPPTDETLVRSPADSARDGETAVQDPAQPSGADEPVFGQGSAQTPAGGGPTFVPPGAPAGSGDEPDPDGPKTKRRSVALPVLALMALIPTLFAMLIAVGAIDAGWESLSVMLAVLALASAGGAVAIALLRPSYLGAGLLVVLAAFIGISSVAVHQVGPFVSDGVGQRTYRPASAAQIQPEYVQGIGRLDIDLRKLDLKPGSRTTINARVGLGQVRIAVPDGARVIAAPGSAVTGLTMTARENGATLKESLTAPVIALKLNVRAGETQLVGGKGPTFDYLQVLASQAAGFWEDADTKDSSRNRPVPPVQRSVTP